MRGKFGKSVGLGVTVVLMALGLPLAAFAAHSTPRAHRGCTDYGGGEMPSPFWGMNERVELADGEAYVLKGKLAILEQHGKRVAYFNVDLDQHPWLANSHRLENPLYLLESAPTEWLYYGGETLRFVGTAHGQVMIDEDGYPRYVISLIPRVEQCELE